MFLALHDEAEKLRGKRRKKAQESLDRIAEALLIISARYRPDSPRTRRATKAFYEDLAEASGARPVYMVFTLVAKAIDEPVSPAPPPGFNGCLIVCAAIRQERPLAPEGFRKVGKQTGGPDVPSESAASFPVRLLGLLGGL